MWSGMIEVNCVFLLFDSRCAHINLPTMRELKMMVMVVCERVVHVERQYTNADEIWQALEYLGIQSLANTLQSRNKCKLQGNELISGNPVRRKHTNMRS